MLSCKDFYQSIIDNGIYYFAGVPDSLLKDFCAYIVDNTSPENHIIAANEGSAVGLAVGHYLATANPALVYMQNSGFGNIINPLLSIADPEVYSIPMLLMIGWRGEPGVEDEPQHLKQGRVNENMLSSMEIPYEILSSNLNEATESVRRAINIISASKEPYALLVRKGTFDKYTLQSKIETNHPLTREAAIRTIIDELDEIDIVVSTTGKTSREVFEYRESLLQGHARDFLTIGGMGHCSQIALAVAQQHKDRTVFCLDGDGAAIMHLGSWAIIGQQKLKNFNHIIINNGAHDSVGGQPTVGFDIDFCAIAKACGYTHVALVENMKDLKSELIHLKNRKGLSLLEVRVRKGARADLGRPTSTPKENKDAFMDFLQKPVKPIV